MRWARSSELPSSLPGDFPAQRTKVCRGGSADRSSIGDASTTVPRHGTIRAAPAISAAWPPGACGKAEVRGAFERGRELARAESERMIVADRLSLPSASLARAGASLLCPATGGSTKPTRRACADLDQRRSPGRRIDRPLATIPSRPASFRTRPARPEVWCRRRSRRRDRARARNSSSADLRLGSA